MATGKKFYWIKLKDSFLTSDKVDFLMSQKDGANYIVLYQMLCLKTINTGGELSRTIGEVIIPYDVEKIQRDCKYFSVDTIRIALQLFKKLGMIYVNSNGTLQIDNFINMVGSETDFAEQKRIQRNNKKCGLIADSSVENVHTDIENRYKRIDKDIDKEKDININTHSINNPCARASDDFDCESAYKFTIDAYGKHGRDACAKQEYMNIILNASDRKATAKNIWGAVKLYSDDYKTNHPDDESLRYMQTFDHWLQNDLNFWTAKLVKGAGND